MSSRLSPKLEYGPDMQPIGQPGASRGIKASPLTDKLKQILVVLQAMQRERKAEELRLFAAEIEADEFRVRQRRRIIADCERLLYGD